MPPKPYKFNMLDKKETQDKTFIMLNSLTTYLRWKLHPISKLRQ